MAFSATGGMASQTGISLRFFGVDQTAGAFRSVAGRIDGLNQTVAGFSARMSSLWNTALIGAAAAGFAKLGKSIAQVCTELSALSDRAADAGTLSPTLQKIVGALGQIGVRGASLDSVSHAMQEMVKRTGETGAEGFAKILGEASRLGTEQERLTFLSNAFGKSMGAAFAPLVAGGEEAVRKFIELAATYPAVSDAAAQTADRAADAMARATDAIKAGWGETAVSIVGWVEATFGPLPEVAASVARGILVAFKAVHDTFKTLALGFRIILEPIITTVALLIGTVWRLVRAVAETGYTLRDALSDSMDEATASFKNMVDGWSDYSEGIFDFSNIGSAAETKPVFDAMREAVAQGGVQFKEEAEEAAENLAGNVAEAISETKPGELRGGDWAAENSAAARRILMLDRSSANKVAVEADRTVSNTLPAIADTAREIKEAAEGTTKAVTQLDEIFEEVFGSGWEAI